MQRYKVIIHFHNNDRFAWVGPQGQQMLSEPNKAFWVSEEEKAILQDNLSDVLEVLHEQ